MSKLMITNIEKNGVRINNVRLQPLITWFHLMNFITIAVLCFVLLKIYKKLLLLYEWLFSFKCKIQAPKILVIGPKNEVIQEIISQLSQRFNSKIISFQDIGLNTSHISRRKGKEKESQIIYSHVPDSSREIIVELSTFVEQAFGFIDILIISQNEDLVENNSTHSFLRQLNRQLLAQFWTVMAFLPGMLRRNNGHIISIALGRSSLTNTGIMRTVHEELLQSKTKVKLTLVERNSFVDDYLPSLSADLLARLIIRSMWNFDTVIKVPSLPSYVLLLPVIFMRFLMKSLVKIVGLTSTRSLQRWNARNSNEWPLT